MAPVARGTSTAAEDPSGADGEMLGTRTRRRRAHRTVDGLSAPRTRTRRSAFPPLVRGHFSRPRLLRLLADPDLSVAVLAAPAGYGKTSLLADWGGHDARTFAWLGLEEADNDGASLLARIALALEQAGVTSEPAPTAVALDGPRARPKALKALLRSAGAVLRAMTGEAGSVVLVLDDVHALRSEESLAVVKAFAVGMPAGSLVALASRSIPALPLARLRAAHALVELGMSDLAMTHAEATALFRARGVRAKNGTVDELVRRTEGWPAALSLAATVISDRAHAASGTAGFDGRDRALVEYVSEEVLAGCTTEMRGFLAEASVLESLSAQVCDAVLERKDSHAMLGGAASGDLVLIPTDREHSEYRCHPLLREVFRAELERLDSSRARELHRRAAAWYRDHGDLERATEHAIAAEDPRLAGELLWASSTRWLNAAAAPAAASAPAQALNAFSDDQVVCAAPLAACAAHERLARGDLPMAEHWARVAAAALESTSDGDHDPSLAAGIGIVLAAGAQDGLELMAERAHEAFAQAPESTPWRAYARLLVGVCEHLSGDRGAARMSLEDGARRAAPFLPGIEALCLAQLALMAAEEQDWERGGDLATMARERLEAGACADQPSAALVFAVLAWICAQEGLAFEAKGNLRRAEQLLEALAEYMPWYEVQARVAMARASIRLADVTLARTLLARASRSARRMPDAAILRGWLDEAWSEIDDLGVSALNGACSLTMAELRILRFLPTHLSFREIGARLHVSTNTVKSQAHAIYAKLGVASRSEAVAQASALGLIEVDVI
jgi:LuxR family transcriptional regulator, maltose regulon positive regulatory protein